VGFLKANAAAAIMVAQRAVRKDRFRYRAPPSYRAAGSSLASLRAGCSLERTESGDMPSGSKDDERQMLELLAADGVGWSRIDRYDRSTTQGAKASMTDAKVLVLYTGGTIGMVNGDPDGPVRRLKPVDDANLLISDVPRLDALRDRVKFDIERLLDDKGAPIPALDSSDVNAAHWAAMARAIQRGYEAYDGFVILHGTDTMAYTASALSFMLANLAKPVVMTGSQLPMSDMRTDGVQNFINALHIAGWRATDLPLVPEVSICFADKLLRGNRARKVSTFAWQAFSTPNYPPLGDIGERIRIYPERTRQVAEDDREPFHATAGLDSRVVEFSLSPGLVLEALERLLTLEKVQGVVLRTFGAGNAPTDIGLLDTVGKAVEDGKVVVNVTQCLEGGVNTGLYAAGGGLLERGVISASDITPEAALTKLMWLLGSEPDRQEVKAQMQIDQRGEQTAISR
jgi:L-asparaginase